MSDDFSATILIADDEPLFLQTTATLLRKANYNCICATNGSSALEILSGEQKIDLIISDLNMPGNLKLELLREGRIHWPDIPLIVVTGAASLPTAIESIRLGISDYLLKPVKYDDLLSSVRRALARREQNRTRNPTESNADRLSIPGIIGESPPMRELYEVISHVADSDANVLITGESGTGKEVVAQAIHRLSGRAAKAFQVIDCTAIPETLFESALFGHEKGSFTGAVKDQAGLLLQADGGTTFFDEIGELPVSLQSKLLRLIQEQVFTPVGKTTPVSIDTRFICATNRNLEVEVATGQFRRDLFYRLAVIHIELPALRHRGEDVLLLAQHFLQQLNESRRPIKGFSEDTQALFLQYSWPGNVRELRNAVERGIAMARSEWIAPSDLPEAIRRSLSQPRDMATLESSAATRVDVVQNAERHYLLQLLRENAGNVSRSAAKAGMSRQGLHKLLKKHDLNADDFRDE